MPRAKPPTGKPGMEHRTQREQVALLNLIRRKLLEPKTPAEIMEELKIPSSTFYDYYRRISKENKEVIKLMQSSDVLQDEFVKLYNRLTKYLGRAEHIYETAEGGGVQVAANRQCMELAVSLMRLHVGGPQAVGIKVVDQEQEKLYRLSNSSAQIAKEAGLVGKLHGYDESKVQHVLDRDGIPDDDTLGE